MELPYPSPVFAAGLFVINVNAIVYKLRKHPEPSITGSLACLLKTDAREGSRHYGDAAAWVKFTLTMQVYAGKINEIGSSRLFIVYTRLSDYIFTATKNRVGHRKYIVHLPDL
ncbi:MAG: hypothetical protein Q9M25_02590 [Mariprofundaceae bacterium]|nr:hypothetical protein [Mariprofundaceae bacterium]